MKKSIKTATDNQLIIQSVEIWYKLHELFKHEGLKPLYGETDRYLLSE